MFVYILFFIIFENKKSTYLMSSNFKYCLFIFMNPKTGQLPSVYMGFSSGPILVTDISHNTNPIAFILSYLLFFSFFFLVSYFCIP